MRENAEESMEVQAVLNAFSVVGRKAKRSYWEERLVSFTERDESETGKVPRRRIVKERGIEKENVVGIGLEVSLLDISRSWFRAMVV